MTDRVRHSVALALLMATVSPAAAEAQIHASAATYSCEGSMARVASNGLVGDQRSEWQVNFRMSVNRAAGTVMIFAVSGTSIIKAGRHALAADPQGRMALSWTTTDQANQPQPVTMTINRDGEFSGAWSESNPSAAMEGMLGGILGPQIGEMMHVTSKGTFSGVCWQ